MAKVDCLAERLVCCESLEWNKKNIVGYTACYVVIESFYPFYEGYAEAKWFKQFKQKVPTQRVEGFLKVYGGHYTLIPFQFRKLHNITYCPNRVENCSFFYKSILVMMNNMR